MTLSQDAARQMVLMEVGVASVRDIVTWADKVIIASDRPHPILIDVSTADIDRYYDVYGYLRKLACDVSRFDALRYALPAIRESIENGRLASDRAASSIYVYLCGQYSEIPEDMRYLYVADDEFYLAVAENYGDRAQIEKKFLQTMHNAEKA